MGVTTDTDVPEVVTYQQASRRPWFFTDPYVPAGSSCAKTRRG